MTKSADIFVIGGGVAGVSAAARLAESARVIVLEAENALGFHATGRSAAIFVRNYEGPIVQQLTAASEDELREPTEISETPILHPRGAMVIAGDAEAPILEALAQVADRITRLSPDDAAARAPFLRPEAIAVGVIEEDAADIDVDLLLQSYARLLRRRGGEIALSARVQGIARENGVWRIEAGGDVFEAPVLVNAAGAWADEIAQLAGARPVGLTPMRRSAALTPAPEGFGPLADWPLVLHAGGQWYCRPQAGKLMVSPGEEDPVPPQDAAADDLRLAEAFDGLHNTTHLKVARVEHRWAGLRTFAPDRAPVVGFDPNVEGFFWLAGQGGFGVQTAPAMARLSADLCLDRQHDWPQELVRGVTPKRFGDAQL